MQQRQSVDRALRRVARRRHRLHNDVYTLIPKLYSICALAHVRAKPSGDGVNRVPAAAPRQSVIPADWILVPAPKGNPGRRPSERRSNRIPQPLCHRLEAGQRRVDAVCGMVWISVCADLRRRGKSLVMALSSISRVTNALRLNCASLQTCRNSAPRQHSVR